MFFRKFIIASICTLILPFSLCAKNKDVFKLNQLQKVRQSVWQEWCQQLAQHDTLPAFSFKALEEASAMRWQLPSELEPNATMPFYSGTKGSKPAEGYPVYVYLHGSGPKAGEWNTGLRLAQAFDDAPSLYLIPQIPNEGEYYRWWQKAKQWAWRHALEKVLAHPDVDASRIYIYGISEGGYGSQRLASFYADYLAGAGPMAGGEPLRNAPAENLCQTAFSLVTGELDRGFYRNQLTQRTKERLDSLQKVYPDEYLHRVMLEPGKGHAMSYTITTPWLKQYQRKAQPTHFRWENYEMDGIKRNCFYNLEVLSEASDDERYDYEFSIKDNVIHLDVKQVNYIITERDPIYGIELNNTRTYTPAQHGMVRIYLSEQLADLSRPVTIYLNGTLLATQRPTLKRSTLTQSCALFADPLRLFPTSIDVKW